MFDWSLQYFPLWEQPAHIRLIVVSLIFLALAAIVFVIHRRRFP